MIEEWQTAEHALRYLNSCADAIPHRTEGEACLLELLPSTAKRILDLGTGNGRLAALIRLQLPKASILGTDFSAPMLDLARARFAEDPAIEIVEHDFRESILDLGRFDAVVSCFAIHHLEDPRKRDLYKEIFAVLAPGGVFANLEHVSSATERLHDEFLAIVGMTRQTEDQSNRLMPVEAQVQWLREIGFQDADCHWKWRELALMAGAKP